MVCRPRLLLADEPTGNLDAATGRGILDVLLKLNQQGQTVVMVTHDPNVATLAHRVIELHDGRVRNPEGSS
jgi:putative ABC transport system ATP-binding protein